METTPRFGSVICLQVLPYKWQQTLEQIVNIALIED
jgi:hypothetical protein